MKNLSSKEIRQMWLDFFKSKQHKIEPSASLVPMNDKTLLFINAGIAPLKKYFDGTEVPSNKRLTNSQKCIRTNDIENVGKTARHHTFFEMLGNFSIGDYFKDEAIEFGFEFLTSKDYLNFDINKLYMTYYPTDMDTKNKWLSLGVKECNLIPLEENFWQIGEGPCGPCTEIFYDRGVSFDSRGVELIEKDLENDRYIEIWNIVFSQYNAQDGVSRKDYKELPNQNIDTGCGLERLTSIIQETNTNFETDLFLPIINKIEEISNVRYDGQMAFKVISDHVRTVTFALSDGAVFSNEDRGYVLRRVLRRACKYAKTLGINKPFMSSLVDVVEDIMGQFYNSLSENKSLVKKLIHTEEEKFLQTLLNGEKKFEQIVLSSKDIISGKDAFLLYDTFGFPVELTIEYAEEKNLKVNINEFKEYMQKQKDLARSSRKDATSMNVQNEVYINYQEISNYIGYDNLESNSKVIKVFEEGIILDNTPFYAFSGGQVSDKGLINDIEVKDVKKLPNGQHLHILNTSSFKEGQVVKASVSKWYQDMVRKNHSATHLLHQALKDILGNHVNQQGSYVSKEYLRFDFNNYELLKDNQILDIEKLVNDTINKELSVNTITTSLEKAKELGATALFGEKYSNEVRFVDMSYSKELCGGLHVSNTKEIKEFAILSLESIASGVYRITACTGSSKETLDNQLIHVNNDIDVVKNKINDLVSNALNEGITLTNNFKDEQVITKGYAFILSTKEKLAKYQQHLHELSKEYQNKKSQNALSDLSKFDTLIKNSSLVTTTDISDINLIKEMAQALLNNKNLDCCFFATTSSDKVTFVAATSPKYDASLLVREAATICDGKGGGKKNLAQAGGKDITKVSDALSHIIGLIS